MVDFSTLLKSILMLFAIVNPVGSIPIFLELTSSLKPKERDKAFRTALISSLAILFIFVIAGQGILTDFFQITLDDLMAAGGVLLLLIAMDHLIFGTLVRGVLKGKKQEAQHIGAVPIGCPILAGPGAMMTVLLIYSGCGFLVAAVSIVAVLGITWLIFRFIDDIYKVLGRTICLVLSKILCLFIAAIGIRLLMQGLSAYFK
ncbi:MAG: NAAT family transporter [Candidatus Omnitrophica bacterium]|nr:NAAT family transporter [Candidatus Omnitrophota bacterium]MBU1924408.1 NAAT family transporter [Candidatus Omnitrophota bacterium]